jgi:peroxiredoxin
VTVSQTQTGTEGVEKDNMALNFSLSDMTGKTFDLHSFRGKKAVHIVFWSSG